MKPIQLTPEQRQDMNRPRKASHDRRLYERLTAVLADRLVRPAVAVLGGEPFVQGADVDWAVGVAADGGLVDGNPVVDGAGEGVGLAGFAGSSVGRALSSQVVSYGAIGNA